MRYLENTRMQKKYMQTRVELHSYSRGIRRRVYIALHDFCYDLQRSTAIYENCRKHVRSRCKRRRVIWSDILFWSISVSRQTHEFETRTEGRTNRWSTKQSLIRAAAVKVKREW